TSFVHDTYLHAVVYKETEDNEDLEQVFRQYSSQHLYSSPHSDESSVKGHFPFIPQVIELREFYIFFKVL
ncbi:11197_t:CDS:1, partial [Scutellospora calospora]